MPEVKLIAVTQPVLENCPDAEALISYIARVSNPSNQENYDTADKLIAYCLKNRHWSIFESVYMTVEIKCSRTIGRQILRHRSFTFQEFSQRYAEVDSSSFEYVEARLQDNKNRQNSIQTDDIKLAAEWEGKQIEILGACKQAYQWAINHGIAKEIARSVLPEGLTQSTMYCTGNLRSFLTYCSLRMSNGTQKEHQEVAKLVWEIVVKQFPSVSNYITKD